MNPKLATEPAPPATVPPPPVIVVDSREQRPLEFRNLAAEPDTLTSGDYSIRGWEECFAVERKSIADLAGSLTRDRERFARECHRLRGFHFARLLIVGSPEELANLRSNVNPKAILASLAAFEIRYRLAVVWEPTPEAAALRLERWAWYFHREQWKPFAKTPPTPTALIGS